MSIAYLNGNWQPLEETRISVLDRGFLFGDGVYEVVPVYSGKAFRLQEHMQRLSGNLEAIRIENPLSADAWNQVVETLIDDLGPVDQALYIQVTRGTSPVRDHAFPADAEPTVFAMTNPLSETDQEKKLQGFAAVTTTDNRWANCQIKAIALLANLLARQGAVDAGAQEAILIRDGNAVEGAASNLFIVSNNLLITPPKSNSLLPGITRDLVLELAARNHVPYAEANIRLADLEAADEIWLTSSTKEILPVVSLNGKPVGQGRVGPGWMRMNELFEISKESFRNGAENE
jgi:D-alanine transaminase